MPLLSGLHTAVFFGSSPNIRQTVVFHYPGGMNHYPSLYWRRRKLVAEAAFHRSQHDVLYCFTDEAARSDRPVQCLTVTAVVQRERDLQFSPLSQWNSNPSEHHR